MKQITATDTNIINTAIKTLESGGLIIFPTETAYGVGVDATNKDAVTKLLDYKKRPEGKAISIAVASKRQAQKYVEINAEADNFYNNFMPGPVTIISNSLGNVDARLEAENGTLGVRIPNYKLMLDILEKFQKPITATSANISGGKTPYSISDILDNIPKKNAELIDLIIDGGTLPRNPPSTVIDTTTNDLTIIRAGRIDPVKSKLVNTITTNSVDETITAGKKFIEENYSENTPLLILLNGELGAGKTHITKGMAEALGISQVIKSPTYNYVNEYKFKDNKLYHMDAWKIQNKQDLEALGFYEWFKKGNVIVVEWPSVIMALDEELFENLKYIFVEFINTGVESRQLKFYLIN